MINLVIFIVFFFLKLCEVIVGVLIWILFVLNGFNCLNGIEFLLIVIFILFKIVFVFFLFKLKFVILISNKWLFVVLLIKWVFGVWLKIFVIVCVFVIICWLYLVKFGFNVFLKVVVFLVIICFNGLFWMFGKILLFIFFVNFLLFVKIKLLWGLCNVLWVVFVMILVYGIGFGCNFEVIKFVICVILIINLVFILLVILWKCLKLIVCEYVFVFVMISFGWCFFVKICMIL